ncbi:MAG: DUF2516 family protein [Jiangellaceae bacterium]
MEIFGVTQNLVLWGLTLASFGLKGYAFVDAVRVRSDAFSAAGKLTKNLWLIFLGVALAVNVVLLYPLNFINLLGVVAAAVYLVDVRPAVRAIGGGHRGGATHDGPYGPW